MISSRPPWRGDGMALGFWRIAMRPGKPMMHGQLGPMHILGLPGNPVSAIVCGILFLVPLIRTLLGRSDVMPLRRTAHRLPSTGRPMIFAKIICGRRFELDADGGIILVTPLHRAGFVHGQRAAAADCLVIRPPNAPRRKAGDVCRDHRPSRGPVIDGARLYVKFTIAEHSANM